MLFRNAEIRFFFGTCVLGFFLVLSDSYAQEKQTLVQKEDWRARVLVGGSLGGSFDERVIDVLPMVGYVLHEHFTLGLAPRYSYHEARHVTNNNASPFSIVPETHHHSYGVQVFAQAQWTLAVIHVEYGLINYSYRNEEAMSTQQTWGSTLALGGGLYIPLFGKRRGGIFVIGVYDFLQDEDLSPYTNRSHGRIGMLMALQKRKK